MRFLLILCNILFSILIVACGHGSNNSGVQPLQNLNITLNESNIYIGSTGTSTVTVSGDNIAYPVVVNFSSESSGIMTVSPTCTIINAESTGCSTTLTGVESGITKIIATATGFNPSQSENITISKLKLAYISVKSDMMGNLLLVCKITNDGDFDCDSYPTMFDYNKASTYGLAFNNTGNISYIANINNVLGCPVENNGTIKLVNNGCTDNTLTFNNNFGGIALGNVYNMLYMAVAPNTISACKINSENGKVIDTGNCSDISSFSATRGVAVSKSGKFVYVANEDQKEVYICPTDANGNINTCTPNTGDDLFTKPFAITVNNNDSKIYVTNTDKDQNVVMCDISADDGDLTNCIATNSIFKTPRGIAISSDNKFAYITNFNGTGYTNPNTPSDVVLKCPLDMTTGMISEAGCINSIKELRGSSGFSEPKAISLVE